MQAQEENKKAVIYQNLGRIDYKECWDLQELLFSEIADTKISDRKNNTFTFKYNHLLFCEHPHVYTLGKSGDQDHLLLNQQELIKKGVVFHKINRGGDITYHGPGQIVAYPILNLEYFFTDIHKYLRLLEEAVILTCAEYGIKAGRSEGLTGVWIDYNDPSKARKICAMGVRCSRWVTMHGLAFNVNTNLDYFNYIVPCGIKDKAVTSMEKELGGKLDYDKVQQILLSKLEQLFQFHLLTKFLKPISF